ncbi:MAG: phosphatase PAP2 family protein [Deltaproteobacteria bacterium]|nr:phosphatase PAP2 family protein [Deltaproteobacteria bacterium]
MRNKEVLKEIVQAPVYFTKDLVKTTGYVLTAPVRWDQTDWLLAGGTLSVTAGLILALDENIKNSVQDERFEHGRDLFEEFEEFTKPWGTYLTLTGLWVGFGSAGILLKDDRAKRTSMEVLEAAAIQAGIVYGLKRIFGRARPWKGEGPHDFDWFDSQRSFPSGHTAFIFSLASTVHAEYPVWWVGVLAYSFAGAIGVERITENAHWASDVFFSAALGTAIGRATVAFHQRNLPVQPVPMAQSDLLGIALEYRF